MLTWKGALVVVGAHVCQRAIAKSSSMHSSVFLLMAHVLSGFLEVLVAHAILTIDRRIVGVGVVSASFGGHFVDCRTWWN